MCFCLCLPHISVCLSSARKMCIFCLRVSFRGHSGCFYPDRYNTFLYKLKKKKAVVHRATELPFRLHWGLVPCYAYLKASQAARPPWRGSKHSLTPWLTSNPHIPSLTCPCFHRSRLETEARGVKSLRSDVTSEVVKKKSSKEALSSPLNPAVYSDGCPLMYKCVSVCCFEDIWSVSASVSCKSCDCSCVCVTLSTRFPLSPPCRLSPC